MRRVFIEEVERRILRALVDDQIIFYSNTPAPGIYAANDDGSNVQPIASPHAATLVEPKFNADENQVLYSAYTGQNRPENYEIYTLDPTSGIETQLTDNAFSDSDASWSPDGGQIVFISNRVDGNNEIWLMNADGSNPVRLTNTQAQEERPVFHPSGRSILYQADNGQNGLDLFSLDLASGQITPLSATAFDERNAAYSPDGKSIAFISDRDDMNGEIYATSSGDIANAARITNNLTSEFSPSFSPDGQRIGFTRDDGGGPSLFSIDGQGDTQAFENGAGGSQMQWASAPAQAVLVDGKLTVWGTGDDDFVSLDVDGTDLNVTRNGVQEIFQAADISSIDVYLREGNDFLGAEAASPEEGSPVGVQRFYCLAGPGDDVVMGGDGNDTITGGAGRNTLYGGNGDDRLNGSNGRDFLYGDGGNDRLYGNGGNDYMVGGGNIDRMWGGDGDDVLSGVGGNDKLYGEAGNDQLFGGDGNDYCDGGPGGSTDIDVINGQKGEDSAFDREEDQFFSIEVF